MPPVISTIVRFGLPPNVSCPISGPAIYFCAEKLVGVARFEPATPSSRTRCTTNARYYRSLDSDMARSVKSFDVVSAHSRPDVKLTLEIEAEAPVGRAWVRRDAENPA
jgi:hypothetical protein